MNAVKRLEVIATNGSETIRIFWLEQRKSGIFGSFFIPGFEMHRSYHLDGAVHFKSRSVRQIKNGETFLRLSGYSRDVVHNHPLARFRGQFQFFMGGHRLDSDVFVRSIPHKFKKANHFVLIDARCLTGQQRHVDLYAYLVEVGHFDCLKEIITSHEAITKRENRIGEYHLYTAFNPWVVLSLIFT
jgi:hypothetical protein